MPVIDPSLLRSCTLLQPTSEVVSADSWKQSFYCVWLMFYDVMAVVWFASWGIWMQWRFGMKYFSTSGLFGPYFVFQCIKWYEFIKCRGNIICLVGTVLSGMQEHSRSVCLIVIHCTMLVLWFRKLRKILLLWQSGI